MTIVLRTAGPKVHISPEGRLDPGPFRLYLAAMQAAGGRFDRARKIHVVPLAAAPTLCLELERAGFTLHANGLGPLLDVHRAGTEKRTEDELTRRIASLGARGLVLRPFQEVGARVLASRDRFLLADQMGLGKTWEAALALPENPRVLIVCPAAVKGVWHAELRRLRPELYVQVLSGRGSFRWPMTGAAVILNYDLLPEPPSQAPTGVTVIADEAHACKSARALRTKRMRAVVRSALDAGGRGWALTGTPLENHPLELRSLLTVFDLFEDVFDDWPTFLRLFHATKRRFRFGEHPQDALEWGTPDPEVALRLRRVSLRRRVDDVLPELPPVTYRDVEVDLPGDVESICDEAMAMLRRRGINLEEVEDLVRITQPGAGFELLSKAFAAIAVAKIPIMESFVEEYEEQAEPLVIFSVHRAPVDAAGTREGWATISGEVKAQDRTEIVRRFQAGELRGVALTTHAGGEGITLTRAAHALLVDSWWNPQKDGQAVARLRRIGQTRPILVTRLVGNHAIDQRIKVLQERKQGLFDAAVEASAVGPSEAPAASEEQTQLFG